MAQAPAIRPGRSHAIQGRSTGTDVGSVQRTDQRHRGCNAAAAGENRRSGEQVNPSQPLTVGVWNDNKCSTTSRSIVPTLSHSTVTRTLPNLRRSSARSKSMAVPDLHGMAQAGLGFRGRSTASVCPPSRGLPALGAGQRQNPDAVSLGFKAGRPSPRSGSMTSSARTERPTIPTKSNYSSKPLPEPMRSTLNREGRGESVSLLHCATGNSRLPSALPSVVTKLGGNRSFPGRRRWIPSVVSPMFLIFSTRSAGQSSRSPTV